MPSRVFRARVSGPNAVRLLITFGKQEQIAAEIVGYGSVSAESPIYELYLFSQESQPWLLDALRLIQHFDDEIAWIGFASADDYWDIPPKTERVSFPPTDRN